MIEKVWYVTIYVEDLQRAVDFYTRTLGIPLRFCSIEEGFASLGTEGATLSLSTAGGTAKANGLVGRETGVALGVRDIASTYEALRKLGVDFLAPPEAHHWGTTAVLLDPDRNALTLDELKERE